MKVTIYSTPTCPYCNQLKDYLKESSIEYTNVDVSVDQEKAKEMIEKSSQMGVPVTNIDGQIVVGFDKKKIAELLKIE